jgi:hypothetical protein
VPVCTGGSEPNNPALGVVRIDGAYLNSVLPGGIQWFDAYLWLIPPFYIDVPAFCAVDPPSLPTIDAQDVLSLLQGDAFSLGLSGAEKFIQWAQVYCWYSMCHCTVGSTPAAPGVQAAPSDLPLINPPGIGDDLYPCDSFVSATTSVPPNVFTNHVSRGLPPHASSVFVTMRNITNGAVHSSMQWAYAFFDLALHNVGSGLLPTVAAGATGTATLAVPPNAYRLDLSVNTGSTIQSNLAQTEIAVTCAISPTPPPVEPLNPAIDGLLRQILSMVTLIQRQGVPFGYIPGAVHTALTGSGSLSVQGLIGAIVTVTATYPDSIGEDSGDPDYLWGLGWINWGSSSEVSPRVRLEAGANLTLPRAAGVYTTLHYSLEPGVQVTITELRREY